MTVQQPETLNDWRDTVHQYAKDKGWWDEDVRYSRSFGDLITLLHSELSEAYEEYRDGHGFNEVYYKGDKPEGIPVEIADVFIRLFDLCGYFNIDIEDVVRAKHAYNLTRPYRHGGKMS